LVSEALKGGSRELLFGFIVVAIGVMAALLLGEVVLRVSGRPEPVVIGWSGRGAGEKNDFGFRGHRLEADARLRVVLLGDSQVEAAGTAFDEMPEVHLQRSLSQGTNGSVSVVSIAAGGWGQDQELLALATYVRDIRPAIVVLWFTAGNDLWNNAFPTHFPKDGWPKPTFWLEGTELKGPNVPWLTSYRPPGLYLVQALRRIRRAPNYPTDGEWERYLPSPYLPTPLGSHSRSLAELLAARRGLRVEELPYFDEENFENEKTHFSMYLVPSSPRLRYAAALTRALLLRVQGVCEAHGARLFVLYTERWSTLPAEPTLFDVRGKGFTLSSASARRLIDGVLDGLATIRVERPAQVVSKTDGHLNAEGNRYVMESVARSLVHQVPLVHRGARRR
jgi:hypothetical protein